MDGRLTGQPPPVPAQKPPLKLKELKKPGTWGVRSETPLQPGNKVEVQRSDGVLTITRIKRLVWTDTKYAWVYECKGLTNKEQGGAPPGGQVAKACPAPPAGAGGTQRLPPHNSR